MTNTQLKPSEVLASLASSLPADTFLIFLAKNLYPALDCLPDAPRSNIVSILEAVQKDHEEVAERIALIDYDAKRESLQNQLAALSKHVKRDWHDGWETQSEMMGKIASEIAEWLQNLWTVGVENGFELGLVHKCLKLCNDITDKAWNCGSRAEFGDFCCPVAIKDKSGKEVYADKYAGLLPAIAWLWRELVLVSLTNGKDDVQAKGMIDDIDKLGFTADVEGQLREGDKTDTVDGTSFHDEHWSDEMREAGGRLKHLLAFKRIGSFENTPTYNIYRSLVSVSPGLKASLLDTARKHFFQERNVQVSWKHAVEIFKDAGSDDDIVWILESMSTSFPLPPAAAVAAAAAVKRDAVSYLMLQSEGYRSKARLHLENGLADAERDLWSELEDAFPGLDEAYEYLDEMIELKKLEKRERPSKGPLDIDRQRDDIIDKFIKIARDSSGKDSDVEDYDYEERMRGIDEDDSDYEDILEELNPDIAGAIRGWVAILNKWPNAAEADEMRSKLSRGDEPLYAVDGVADVLADRCDWSWNNSSAKIHVAEGIRAAYVAFGPDGPAKDKMKSSL